MEKLYGKDRKTILREFQTTEKGLSDNEVRNRKDIFGDNALKEKKRKGILKVFLNPFNVLGIILHFSINSSHSFLVGTLTSLPSNVVAGSWLASSLSLK